MKTASMKPIKVKSQTNTKKAKFNLSHDVNTTYDWGEVQPLLSKLMLPDSSINVNMEQLTRLAPMVAPTFGRVKMKNTAHFVPIKDIFPNWEYLLAKKPVTRPTTGGTTAFVPTKIPNINNTILTAFALAGAKVNWYCGTPDSNGIVQAWNHYDNQGTWSTVSPTGNDNGIKAGRALLSFILAINNAQTPTNTTLNSIGYTGPTYNISKITKGSQSNGIAMSRTIALPDGEYFADVPAISTMYPNTLDTNIYGMNGRTHSANDERYLGAYGYEDKHITMEEADLIWESDDITTAKRSDSTSVWNGFTNSFFDGMRVRLCFKLSSFGKRLRKILIALGYNFSLNDDSNVSILPLLAFYKAWWDTYAPERDQNFYTTSAWALSQFVSDANTQADLSTIIPGSGYAAAREIIKKFILKELGNCFATEPINAISAATKDPIMTANNSANMAAMDIVNAQLQAWYQNYVVPGNGDSMANTKVDNNSSNSVPAIRASISVPSQPTELKTITQPVLDAIKKAYIYVNKMSVAGYQMAEILRMNGQGKYVEECRGKFIAGSEDSIKISDVVSTADTTAYTGIKGAALGQYGGRGLGMGTDQFSYQTDVHGYLELISAIIPETGYTNCVDLTNEVVSYDGFYNAEFDGLNYEAVQKKQLVGSTVINKRDDNSHNDTFGFLPTYSKWKITNNIANGDFSLASQRQSLIPYTLDKYIPVNEVNVTETTINTAGSSHIEQKWVTNPFMFSDLPNAGEDYRYINKMPWNGNYNRIFAAIGDGLEWETIVSNNNGAYLYNSFEYDNFLTHNVLNIAYWAPMKSIEDSYSTYDEDDTASTGGISHS